MLKMTTFTKEREASTFTQAPCSAPLMRLGLRSQGPGTQRPGWRLRPLRPQIPEQCLVPNGHSINIWQINKLISGRLTDEHSTFPVSEDSL